MYGSRLELGIIGDGMGCLPRKQGWPNWCPVLKKGHILLTGFYLGKLQIPIYLVTQIDSCPGPRKGKWEQQIFWGSWVISLRKAMWISKFSEEACDHMQESWVLINLSGNRSMWLLGQLAHDFWWEKACRKEHLVVTERTPLLEDGSQTPLPLTKLGEDTFTCLLPHCCDGV